MENTKSKRIWSAEETKAFLHAYGKRKFEFESTRLKKFAMKNVLEDLISLGVLTQPTTEDMLRVKLKNLLWAFKSSIDNIKRTGESHIKAPFEDQMNEIFGSQPIIKNTHSINLCGKQVEGLPMEAISILQKESTETPEASGTAPITETVSVSQPESSTSSSEEEASTSSSIGASSSKRQVVGSKRRYWEMKEKRAAERHLIIKEYTASKLKKMDEAEKGREARLARKEKLLRELFDKP